MTPILSVVLPAHNEVDGIRDVLERLHDEVTARFEPGEVEIVVVDDASTDATAEVLDGLTGELPELAVVRQPANLGHGPTLVRAIDESRAPWIFHVDSDGQFDPADFSRLWAARDGSELVLGVRSHRQDPRHRLVLSRLVAHLVGRLAGHPVRDANTPFKLFRRSLWDEVRPLMPADPFAPSVLLVLGAHRLGRSVFEVPVGHLPRPHGTSHLRPVRLGRGVLAALGDTVRFQRRLRS
jgi:dolichol-phosphate mannosyltransferase